MMIETGGETVTGQTGIETVETAGMALRLEDQEVERDGRTVTETEKEIATEKRTENATDGGTIEIEAIEVTGTEKETETLEGHDHLKLHRRVVAELFHLQQRGMLQRQHRQLRLQRQSQLRMEHSYLLLLLQLRQQVMERRRRKRQKKQSCV